MHLVAPRFEQQDHLGMIGNGRKEGFQPQALLRMSRRIKIQRHLGLALQDGFGLAQGGFAQRHAQHMHMSRLIHMRVRRGAGVLIMHAGP